MKKIILLSLLLSSLAFGEAKLYVGTGYAYSNSQLSIANSNVEESNSAHTARIKAGYGIREAYAVEFSMDYINSDPKKYSFDVSLIKAFDLDIFINPFVKAGFGAGILDNRDTNKKSLTYGSFHLGAGFYIPMNENFDFEVAYEYRNRSYERENTKEETQSNTSHVNLAYIGLNVRF